MIYSAIVRYGFLFIIFSLGGFCVSCMYKTLREKRFVHSGLLAGPFIPVYGVGGVAIVLLRSVMQGFPLFLFILLSTLLFSALEFVASWVLESMFGLRLWDYSHHLLSVRGRICFLSGTFWFILSYVCLIYAAPFGEAVFSIMPSAVSSLIVGGFLLYLLWDLATSFKRNRTCLHMISSVIDPDKISELPSLRLNPTLTKGICYLLRILSGYPYLGRFLLMRFRDVPQLVLRMQKWVSRVVSFDGDDYRENEVFIALIKPIVEHPAYERLKDYRYGDVSLAEYTTGVAWIMFKVAGFLGLSVEEAVRGALFHRFYYHQDRERGIPAKFSNWNHPEEAERHARVYFPPVTRKEIDMIRKAGWPLESAVPRYPESFLLSMIDSFMSSRLRRGMFQQRGLAFK